MDGIGLPPPPIPGGTASVAPASSTSHPQTPPPPPGSYQAGSYQQQPSQGGNPVGRPSVDPDRNAERAEQSATVNRMLKNLPKAATDPRIAIYRLKGKAGRHAEPRSLLNILMSDVEEAVENEIAPEEYIQERIESELPSGRYLCVPQDNHGNRVKKAAQWEVNTMDPRDYDEEDDDPRGSRHGHEEEEMFVPGMPGMEMPPGGFPGYGQRPPPPMPNIYPDDNAIDQLRDLMREKQSKEESGNNMLVMMMQQQQMNEQRLREEREVRERERREEDRKWREEQRIAEERREERDRQARNDKLQLIATIAPVFAPLLQKMMDGKEDKITPLLLTKLMESDNNRNSAHEMISMMSEASKQQVLLQGEMSRQNMAQQSEANTMMMNHVLKMAQDTITAQRTLEEGDDGDPLSKFGKVISTLAPMLQGAQAYTGGKPTGYQQPPAQQQLPAQPAPPVQQPPAERQTVQPPTRETQATRDTAPDVPDEQWIYGALNTIMRVETGDIPAEKRPEALMWCATNLPHDMQQAILSDDEQTIMGRAGSIVMSDAKLKDWITDEEDGEVHQAFLMGCINDIKMILSNQVDEDRFHAMIEEQKSYLGQKENREAPGKQNAPEPANDASMTASEEEFDGSRIEDDPYGESSDASSLYASSEQDETGLSDDEEEATEETDAAKEQ